MRQKMVEFFSDGSRVKGIVETPDHDGPLPGIVLCAGYGGIKERLLPDIAHALVHVGYAVLRFDYRGFGESEGVRDRLFPLEQVEDIRSALTYLGEERPVDASRLGLLGISFGGGNAAYTAGVDARVRCAVCVVGFGNGERWMRRLRRQWEWREFVERLARDRVARVVNGRSEVVDRLEIMVPDPLSAKVLDEAVRAYPTAYFKLSLASAEKIIEFKPEDVVDRVAPRAILFIHAGDDDLISPEESQLMYARAREPKRLVVLPGVPHYGVYSGEAFRRVIALAHEWYGTHFALRSGTAAFPSANEEEIS
ncbi:MAG: alpha/beta hydrolase [Candidatus Rokuibacteriota bacterium]